MLVGKVHPDENPGAIGLRFEANLLKISCDCVIQLRRWAGGGSCDDLILLSRNLFLMTSIEMRRAKREERETAEREGAGSTAVIGADMVFLSVEQSSLRR